MAAIATTVAASATAKAGDVASVTVPTVVTGGSVLFCSVTMVTKDPLGAAVKSISGGGAWQLRAVATDGAVRKELWDVTALASQSAVQVVIALSGVTDSAKVCVSEVVSCKRVLGFSCSPEDLGPITIVVADPVLGNKSYAIEPHTGVVTVLT